MTDSLRVMVVDDDAAMRGKLSGLLVAAGQDVVACSNHTSLAGDLARVEQPAVVFVGIEAPLSRHLQTVQFLSELLVDAWVIAYSSLTQISVFQQAVRAGARLLLELPFEVKALERALAAAAGAKLPSSEPAAGNAGRIISIVGQKGGIGKTAVSVNLASALAQETKSSVLIVDFDTSFGDVGLALDVESPTTVARAAFDISRMDISEFKASITSHESGAFVLSAPGHVGEWLRVTPDDLEALVTTAATLFDYVLVDTPGAFNDAVASAIAISDNLLVVTSLELTSAKNTSMLLEILGAEGYEMSHTMIIANHTFADTGLRITDLAPVLSCDSIWDVPFDADMRIASQVGRPLVMTNPESFAAKSLSALAHRLATEPTRIERRKVLRAEAPRRRPGLRQRVRAALIRANLAQAS
ncbi:MAG: AAA family ATPase [Tepidiformaceae bacterium]